MTPDLEDENPLVYDAPGDLEFIPDAASYNPELGISVAIDYEPDSTISPVIEIAIPNEEFDIHLGDFFSIVTTSEEDFDSIIQIAYEDGIVEEEEYLRLYFEDEDG